MIYDLILVTAATVALVIGIVLGLHVLFKETTK